MYHIRYEDENYAVWLEPDDTQISLWAEREPIFVCGKLMEPAFLSGVIGREPAMAPAVALNCSRAWQDYKGKATRFLIKSEEGFVPGMALLGITDGERKKIEEDHFQKYSEKKMIPAGKVKYDKLHDNEKTFSIKNALNGVPLTNNELQKVKTQIQEFFADEILQRENAQQN